MNAKITDQIKEMISNFTSLVEKKERALEMGRGVIALQSWIVVVEGVAVDPEIKDGRSVPGSVKTGGAESVRRFSHSDAERIASVTMNGNGTYGKAVFWMDAVKEEIKKIKESIVVLEQRLADFS